MDEAGQHNFSKALSVAKQIFNSLTEYIQVMLMRFTCVRVQCMALHFMRLYFLYLGPLHWKSAEFGTQQVVGCGGRVPACFRQHANEIVTGTVTHQCIQDLGD